MQASRATTPDGPSGVVCAFRFPGDGTAAPCPAEAAPAGDGSWAWIHLDLVDARLRGWVATIDALPAEARALLLSGDRHPQLHALPGCVYGTLVDFSREFDHVGDETGVLWFAATERLMVSGRKHRLQAVDALRQSVAAGHGFATAGALVENLVMRIADAVERSIDGGLEELNAIEDRVIGESLGDERRRLGRVRSAAVRLHRQLSGLRGSMLRLELDDGGPAGPPFHLATKRLAQRLDALGHAVEAILERARLLHDEITSKLAEETNQRLHFLSSVTLLLLPPTLTAGLFGMNLEGMPFSGDPNGFWWATLLTVAEAGGVYWLLRRLGVAR